MNNPTNSIPPPPPPPNLLTALSSQPPTMLQPPPPPPPPPSTFQSTSLSLFPPPPPPIPHSTMHMHHMNSQHTPQIDINAMNQLIEQKEKEQQEKLLQKQREQLDREELLHSTKIKEQQERLDRDRAEKEAKIQQLKAQKERQDEEKKEKLAKLQAEKLKKKGITTSTDTPASNLPPSSSMNDIISPKHENKESQFSHLTSSQRERVFLNLIATNYNTPRTIDIGSGAGLGHALTWTQFLPIIVTHQDFHSVPQLQRRRELYTLFISSPHLNISSHLSMEDKLRFEEQQALEAQLTDQLFVFSPQSQLINISTLPTSNSSTTSTHNMGNNQSPSNNILQIPTQCYPSTTVPKYPWLIDSLMEFYHQTHQNNYRQSHTQDNDTKTSVTPPHCALCKIMNLLHSQITSQASSNSATSSATSPLRPLTTTGNLLCPQHSASTQPFITTLLNDLPPHTQFLPLTLNFSPKPRTIFSSSEYQIEYHNHVRSFLNSMVFSFITKFIMLFSGLCWTDEELSLFHIIGHKAPPPTTIVLSETKPKFPTKSHLASNAHQKVYHVRSAIGSQSITVDTNVNQPSQGGMGNWHQKKSKQSIITRYDYELLLSSTCPTDIQHIVEKIPYLAKADVSSLNTVVVMLKFYQLFGKLNQGLGLSNTLTQNSTASSFIPSTSSVSEQKLSSIEQFFTTTNDNAEFYSSQAFQYIFSPQLSTSSSTTTTTTSTLLQPNSVSVSNTMINCIKCKTQCPCCCDCSFPLPSDPSKPLIPFFPPLISQLLLSSRYNPHPITSQDAMAAIIKLLINSPLFTTLTSSLLPQYSIVAQQNALTQTDVSIADTNQLPEIKAHINGKELLIKALLYILPFIQAKLSYYIRSFASMRSSFVQNINQKFPSIGTRLTNISKMKEKMYTKSLQYTPITSSRMTSDTIGLDDYSDNENDENTNNNTHEDEFNMKLVGGSKSIYNTALTTFIDSILTQVYENTTMKADIISRLFHSTSSQSTVSLFDVEPTPQFITTSGIDNVINYAKIKQYQQELQNETRFHPSLLHHPHRLFQSLPIQSISAFSSQDFIDNSQNNKNSTNPSNLKQLFSQPTWLSKFLHTRTTSLLFSTPQNQSNTTSNNISVIYTPEYITTQHENNDINFFSQSLVTTPPFLPISMLLFPPRSSHQLHPSNCHAMPRKIIVNPHDDNVTDLSNLSLSSNQEFKLSYINFPHEFITLDQKNNTGIYSSELPSTSLLNDGYFYCPCMKSLHTPLSSTSTSQDNYIKPHFLCLLQFFTNFSTLSFEQYSTYTSAIANVSTSSTDTTTTLTSTIENIPYKYEQQPFIFTAPPSLVNFSAASSISPHLVPNVYLDDFHTLSYTHYFLQLPSPSNSMQPSTVTHQLRAPPSQSLSYHDSTIFHPMMNFLGQVAESSLDAVSEQMRTQIDCIKDLYDPIFNSFISTYKQQNELYHALSIESQREQFQHSQSLQNFKPMNFLSLFQHIHNKIIEQRNILTGSSSHSISLRSADFMDTSIPSIDPTAPSPHTSFLAVPAPPVVLPHLMKVLKSSSLTRDIWIYHCIKHDIAFFRLMYPLRIEQKEFSTFILECNKQLTQSYIAAKVRLFCKNYMQSLSTGSDNNDPIQISLASFLSTDQIYQKLNITFPPLPTCSCDLEDLNNHVTDNSLISSQVQQKQQLTKFNKQTQCLHHYIQFSREFYYYQYLHDIVSESTKQ